MVFFVKKQSVLSGARSQKPAQRRKKTATEKTEKNRRNGKHNFKLPETPCFRGKNPPAPDGRRGQDERALGQPLGDVRRRSSSVPTRRGAVDGSM